MVDVINIYNTSGVLHLESYEPTQCIRENIDSVHFTDFQSVSCMKAGISLNTGYREQLPLPVNAHGEIDDIPHAGFDLIHIIESWSRACIVLELIMSLNSGIHDVPIDRCKVER